MANGLPDPLELKKLPGASVSNRVRGLLQQNSPLMQQARTQGLQTANRRGLLNSSMGVQAAQQAVTDVALPIASQEAQQAHNERLTRLDIAERSRAKATDAAAAVEATYAQMFGALAQNPEMPREARDSYIQHLGRVRDSSLGLLEQMYGFELEWSTPNVTPSADNNPTPVDVPARPPKPKGSGQIWTGTHWRRDSN